MSTHKGNGAGIVLQASAIRRCLAWTLVLCDCAYPMARAATEVADIPTPDHVVIVIEENKSYANIIGGNDAPYINLLARQGANFSQFFALTHPSQPNYLALFSGSTQGVTDNSCPHTFSGENLGALLLQAGRDFAVYSESIPAAGYTGCEDGRYARKHNPAVNWQGVSLPASVNLSFASFDLEHLPTVSIVVPNMANDMHDGSIRQGDDWLRKHIEPYVQWAKTHNSLLILTWDEGAKQSDNQIPTIFVGPMIKPGVYSQRFDHYSMLATIADMYRLPRLGNSKTAAPISEIWDKAYGPAPSLTNIPAAMRAVSPSRKLDGRKE